MSQEVAGVPLTKFEDPIRDALAQYVQHTDKRLVLDRDAAAQLNLTPEKPNSARSQTDAYFDDMPIGSLFVIAFKPGDGTGDLNSYSLSDYGVAKPYPRAPKIVPRNKIGVHSEVLLTLATQELESPNSDPELFEGQYDLLSINRAISQIARYAILGRKYPSSANRPRAHYTVAHYGKLLDSSLGGTERFGDPHAIYSRVEDKIQIAGFLAISDEVRRRDNPELFHLLGARMPAVKYIHSE